MGGAIKLNRQVFDKGKFKDTVNTDFTELTQTETPSITSNNTEETSQNNEQEVQNFFELYDRLFYNIPKDGETDSHNYIINRSSKYTDFVYQIEQMQVMVDEIKYLRDTVQTLSRENKTLKANLGLRDINLDSLTVSNG